MTTNCHKCGCRLRGKQIRVHSSATDVKCRQCYSMAYLPDGEKHLLWIMPMLRRVGECATIGELMGVYNAYRSSIDTLGEKQKALVMAAFTNVKEEINR